MASMAVSVLLQQLLCATCRLAGVGVLEYVPPGWKSRLADVSVRWCCRLGVSLAGPDDMMLDIPAPALGRKGARDRWSAEKDDLIER
jgi:hypothetical protein